MTYKSNLGESFRNQFAETIFAQKYRHEGCETWPDLANSLVEDVCREFLSREDKSQLKRYIREMKFIPGGRYLYYANRQKKYFNNCYTLAALEDTREDWAELSKKAELCLTVGGGIGIDFTRYRERGSLLHGTGGVASGPVSKMMMINEIGRQVIQGGSRRSAEYGSLNWKHPDAWELLHSKDWYNIKVAGTDKSLGQLKEHDFNFPCPLDLMNISLNYDTSWLLEYWRTGDLPEIFIKNCYQAMKTGEPGFSFNFFDKENETMRNACTELTSEDDSDVCDLGSLNFGRIETISELKDVTDLATKFLICGTLVAELPYLKVHTIREKNRRLGLGLMGCHEWLVQRGYKYEVNNEFKQWLYVYEHISRDIANKYSDALHISRPVACRAIAPTGSIGILASTTTGIEPVYAVAFKRRYLKGTSWKYQYTIDGAAKELIDRYGTNPENIESSLDLAKDYERRIKFQASVQDYVDHAISSTINLPNWGTEFNNEDLVKSFAHTLARYAHKLRGFTVYPNGARGGQPLNSVPYSEAIDKLGIELEENTQIMDVCEISGRGGSCGA